MIEAAELDRAIREYEENGATVLRGVIDTMWIDKLGPAVDRLMRAGEHGMDMGDGEGGKFFGDLFSWLHTSEISDFLHNSELPELAGRIMRSKEVRLFYDQLLVKEPGAKKRTPWHQDLPYWPVQGEQVISFWVPIDPAGPENGVVTYVKGSHRWNRFFPQQPFLEAARADIEREAAQVSIYDDPFAPGQPRNLADIRDHPEKYEFISYEVVPGDVIVHHPLTIHGAPGNLSTSARRRALATRWFGDDARWNDDRPNFMRSLLRNTAFPYPGLSHGDPINDPIFPLVWEAA